jgi:hypothetical protein
MFQILARMRARGFGVSRRRAGLRTTSQVAEVETIHKIRQSLIGPL